MLEDTLFCPMNMVYLLEQLDAGRVTMEESHNHGYRFLRVRDLQLYYTIGACLNIDQWLKVKHDVYYFLFFSGYFGLSERCLSKMVQFTHVRYIF